MTTFHDALVNLDRSGNTDEIQKRFGEESLWVWNILRGIDHTEGGLPPPTMYPVTSTMSLLIGDNDHVGWISNGEIRQ